MKMISDPHRYDNRELWRVPVLQLWFTGSMAAVSSRFLPVFSKQHSWTRNTHIQEILVLLCCFTLTSTTALHHQVLVDSDVLLFLTVCFHQETVTP